MCESTLISLGHFYFFLTLLKSCVFAYINKCRRVLIGKMVLSSSATNDKVLDIKSVECSVNMSA